MPTGSVSAPIGGWNARDSVDQMPPTDAIELINMIPQSGLCEGRAGFSEYIDTLSSDDVETLVEYRSGAGKKFLAAAGDKIFDITTPPTATTLGSSYTNARWITIAFKDQLIFCNGVDTPQVYDGTAIIPIVITGPTVTDLSGGFTFKGRVFYWENASQSFWYAAADAYQGAISEFDLGGQVIRGGNIRFITSWTRDSGDGMDDLIVFVFDTGETLVYQGDDPGNAATWNKIGLFNIGQPVSARGHARQAADEIIITQDGYVNLVTALSSGRVSDRIHIGGKIINAVKARIASFGDNFGWEIVFWPEGNLLIVNVPLTTNSTYEQHVLNTNTGAWCKFEGLQARTWGVFDGALYFGGDEKVFKYTGADDDGNEITVHALPAFTQLDAPGLNKQVGAVRLVTNMQNANEISVLGVANYRIPPKGTAPVITIPVGSLWDVSPWDTSPWSGSDGSVSTDWRSIIANGFAVTIQFRLQIKTLIPRWFAGIYQYKIGGPV